MPIVDGAYQNPGWVDGTEPAINDVELNAISDSLECLPVANGGTGATTIAGARNALGLGNTDGAIPIANGGTGATTVAGARNALGLGNTDGAIPIANGGTGATTAAAARTNLGINATNLGYVPATGGTFTGDVTIRDVFYATNTGVEMSNADIFLLGASGFTASTVVPVANGGTGATTAAAARTNLGVKSISVVRVPYGTSGYSITEGNDWGEVRMSAVSPDAQLPLFICFEGASSADLRITQILKDTRGNSLYILFFNRTATSSDQPTLYMLVAEGYATAA